VLVNNIFSHLLHMSHQNQSNNQPITNPQINKSTNRLQTPKSINQPITAP
jgi:hypothetical protein